MADMSASASEQPGTENAARDEANPSRGQQSVSSSQAAPPKNDTFPHPHVIPTAPGASARTYQTTIRVLNKLFLPAFKIWVAGEKIDDAIKETKKLNARHPKATAIINFLGEHYTQDWKVLRTVNEYMRAIGRISDSRVRASISLKPSQMGFDLPENGPSTAERNMTAIVEAAAKRGIFAWIDMEHTGYTDFTVVTYREWLRTMSNVGIVLQANLKRTMADLRTLCTLDRGEYPNPAKIRLCKGIYKEPPEVSFTQKPDVNRNFGELIEYLISEAPQDVWAAVASHDDVYTDLGIKLNAARPHAFFEVQMLRGVRPELQTELMERDIQLAVYTPYGEDSLPYSFRRATRANNLTATVIRSLLSGIYKKVYQK